MNQPAEETLTFVRQERVRNIKDGKLYTIVRPIYNVDVVNDGKWYVTWRVEDEIGQTREFNENFLEKTAL